MLKIKIEEVEKIITEVADSIIVPRFRNLSAHEIHFKGEDDPYTIADLEAEKELKDRLIDLLPTSKVVGEEEFASNNAVLDHFLGDSPVWTIDPVDGTKCFIAGEPFYGVIVSLSEQNQAIAGWLYDPTSREFITSEKGSGAYYKGQKLSVLPPDSLDKMSGIIGHRIICELKDNQEECKEKKECPKILRMRSSCHDYARLVAPEGHFSKQLPIAHFHTWKATCTPWDNIAGILIHSEAGGYTAHWDKTKVLSNAYGRGVLSAPDKDSWEEIHAWMHSFCGV